MNCWRISIGSAYAQILMTICHQIPIFNSCLFQLQPGPLRWALTRCHCRTGRAMFEDFSFVNVFHRYLLPAFTYRLAGEFPVSCSHAPAVLRAVSSDHSSREAICS